MTSNADRFTEELLEVIEGGNDILLRTVYKHNPQFSDKELVALFDKVATKLTGKNYKTNGIECERVIVKLLKWLFGQAECGLELKKGICLIGPIGCGKTTVLEVLSRMSYAMGYQYEIQGQRYPFHWPTVTSYEIIDAFVHGTRLKEFANQHILFIDSLGEEQTDVNYCGTVFNPIKQLMTMRCARKDQMTFITMRDTVAANILSKYGEDGSSLLHGLCNVLHFPGPDYRQIKN